MSSDRKRVYHVGIIDFLQLWDWNKYAEAKAKSIFQGKDSKLISAVPPDYYQKRFADFMNEKVLQPESVSDMSTSDISCFKRSTAKKIPDSKQRFIEGLMF